MIRLNTGNLYRILRDFYTLTNIRIVLIDNEFQELLSYPEEHFSFCSRIRKARQIDKSCIKSDRNACLKCRKSRELCEEFSIGKTRLYEAASAYLDCGLMEYVRGQRILHAQDMLQNTKLSVGEIAYAVGFSDYTHFSRIFKQVNGIFAREYRNREK